MHTTSSFKRLYGMYLKDMARELGFSVGKTHSLHKKGLLKKMEKHLPEELDPRIRIAFNNAKTRCKNRSNRNTKYYISKGIKFLLTWEEIIKLWNRDDAQKMEIPSLDRKNSDKDYSYNNCRFIEWESNRARR